MGLRLEAKDESRSGLAPDLALLCRWRRLGGASRKALAESKEHAPVSFGWRALSVFGGRHAQAA